MRPVCIVPSHGDRGLRRNPVVITVATPPRPPRPLSSSPLLQYRGMAAGRFSVFV
ncbi:hypothetical protein EJB05_55915 [Eragrostis curvula]|uniref:Uncharacterized protein n=1 Tax=Eragrostis curvula TaxID=38414 RepID=A0A5J9SHL5_9POAL|nr:hypothetical protein EJB05_55915 [Eragrostis curvula]